MEKIRKDSRTKGSRKISEINLLEGGMLLDAANLRRDPADAKIWRRAGIPKRLFSLGALPFLRFSPYGDGREIELWVDGENRLYGWAINQGDTPTGMPRKIGELKGAPILAITAAKGIIRLMLKHAKDCFLTYDEELHLTFEGEMPALPEIVLEARDATIYYGSTGNIALSGGSSGMAGSQLCEADATKVKLALLGAYESVREQARKNGNWLQPIAARYRLLDAAGNTVALGEKVTLGCLGMIPTEKVALTSSDGMQSLAAGSLAAQSYNPVLVVPERLPYPWDRIIDKLVVEVTEEMAPVDAAARLPHSVYRNAATGLTTVSAQLPGLEIEEQFTRERYNQLAAQQLKAAMYRPFIYDNPLGGGLTLNGQELQPGDHLPLEGLEPVYFDKVAEGTDEGMRGRSSYSAALDAGEFTLLCNPKNEESGEYEPGVAEIVRSEDLGSILSRRRIMEGEIVKIANLPRSGSGWDFSRLKVLMFGNEGTKLATLNGKGEFHSVTTIDRRSVGSGQAVCDATGGSGATLLAIAGGDVVEISGQKVSTLWSPRELPQGRFGAESLAGMRGIGWSETQKEVWLADETRLWRLCGRGQELIRAALPGIEGIDYQPPFRFGNREGELLLATSREVRNLSAEQPEGLMDIRLRIRGRLPEQISGALLPSASGASAPWLQLRVFGSGLMGNFTLRGDRGTEIAEELFRVVITGDVNAPIPLRVALPYRHWLEADFTFAANADFAIHPTLIFPTE